MHDHSSVYSICFMHFPHLQPKLNRKSELIAAQSRPNMPIEDLLAGKGKLLQQKQAERERRLEQKAQELRQVVNF